MTHRYYMMNKPAGVITACKDTQQKTVMDLLPPDIANGLHPIGRLDIDTCGLLLLTDDGQLDHLLLQPTRHVAKTYRITAIGKLTDNAINMIEHGVTLESNSLVSRPAKITLIQETTVNAITELLPLDRKKRYLKNPNGSAFVADLIIYEGRKHQVKRMLRAVGCRVCFLERIAIGSVKLDDWLPRGGFRSLTEAEIQALMP